MSYIVILQRKERILAVEEGGDKEDWPPSPAAIAARWLEQGTARDSDRIHVFRSETGWFYSRIKGVPG